MRIYSGTSNRQLTKRICESLSPLYPKVEQRIPNLSIERFSDGEILPKFNESVRDKDIMFVQTTDTSDAIMETLLVVDAAKRAGVRSFTLVAPFQGYSRQDKTDHLRSSIGSKVLADILDKVGVSKVITIDLHASAIQGFYNIPVVHINGNKIFIDYIRSLEIEDLCLVAPDQGSIKKVSNFMKYFPDSCFAMINKKRIKPNEVHSMELMGSVEGKNVIIIDDLVDTGGTLSKASDLLIKNGAKSTRAICTHGVLSGDGVNIIRNSSLTELIVSDSIESVLQKAKDPQNKINVISCGDLLSSIMSAMDRKKSVHEINQS